GDEARGAELHRFLHRPLEPWKFDDRRLNLDHGGGSRRLQLLDQPKHHFGVRRGFDFGAKQPLVVRDLDPFTRPDAPDAAELPPTLAGRPGAAALDPSYENSAQSQRSVTQPSGAQTPSPRHGVRLVASRAGRSEEDAALDVDLQGRNVAHRPRPRGPHRMAHL